MESKFKKILLQSTVFTCLSSGVNVTMALEGDRETTATAEYHSHHAENFVNVADTNPAMAAIKKQQQAHRETIVADVTLMLGAITDTTVQGNLDNLKNMIAAALTADADAINDIEDKHDAKKTATVDTAETLLEKADLYNTAKDKGSIPLDIQHYRLAYFLMLKLQPWLADNYKNDPDEVDTLLKNHIPTYYPEWTDQKILIKGLKVKLDNTAKPDAEEPKIKFSTAQTKIPAGTKVYSYIDGNGTEVDDSTYTISLSVDGSDATISGLTYGIYYVEVDGVKQYFAVNSTKENEIIYSLDGIVKFTTAINKGLRTAAVENKDFRPKLRLLRNGNVLGTETFKVRLEGEKTWKKLDDFETNDFLLSDHKLEFSGLNAGTYTFEAAASDEVVVKPLTTIGVGTNKNGQNQSITDRDSFEILKSIVTFTAMAKDKTYDGNTTAEITSWSAKANNNTEYRSLDTTGFAPAIYLTGGFVDAAVGTDKIVNGTVAFNLGADTDAAYKENYLPLPTFTTKANINAVVAAGTGTGGGGTTTTTTPGLAFSAIIPNTGSPYLKAKGTASNIPAGTYDVSIISTSNPDGIGTIVVEANGDYKVSLSGLTFAAGGESVTVAITTQGNYAGTSFTFNSPVITAAFAAATDGTGSVEFTVGAAFNGITPNFVAGGGVTGYTGGTSIASGKVTRGYTTATLGSITTGQKIIIEGTNFTFSGTANSTLDSNNFSLNGYDPNDSMTASVVTISDLSRLVPDGDLVSDVVVRDVMNDLEIDFDHVDTFGGGAFIIHLADGATLENETTITFKYKGVDYIVIYSPEVNAG